MALLQADSSSIAPILQDKQDKDNKDTSDQVDSGSYVNIVSGDSLFPATSHVSIPGSAGSGDSSSDQMSIYVIRKGDSISQIADMFGVSANTILWANDMKKGDKLVEGDTLIILPISGVKHTVLKGQTLKGIAKKYGVDVSDIAGFNGIAEDAQLSVGDELIIPDGQMTDDGGSPSKTSSNSSSSSKSKKVYYETYNLANYTGYFINPVPGARLSQGIHDNNAVDLAIAKGTPIHAAAAGEVIFAKMGWNGAFGGLVIIDHANGTQTLYAHQSQVLAHVGDEVSRGDVIGLVGSTGHSTGPHLHFEVHGARNPGADDSWKY